MSEPFVHPSADVETGAVLGDGVRVWHHAQVRPGARLGPGCIIGKGAYIDAGVILGANCKVQNYSCLYAQLELEDGVFVGPEVVFTNDRNPRAITPTGELKGGEDWELGRTLVKHGAAVGSRTVVVTGITIGRWAMIGAGSVVTRDVPDHALVFGTPARQAGWVCACGIRLADDLSCPSCRRIYQRSGEGLVEAGQKAATS